MANTYSTVSPANTTFLNDIYVAMAAKYTTDLTLHTLTTTDYIFTLPTLCEKVVRINYSTSDVITLYIGDAFVSGTTLTNSISAISSQTGTSYSTVKTTGHLILGTSFMLLNILNSHANEKSTIILLGKATNNDSLAVAYSGGFVNADAAVGSMGRNITKNSLLSIVGFQNVMINAAGKPYKMPIQFTDGANKGLLLTNIDGSIATISDLYSCSWAIDAYTPFVGANAFITTAPMLGLGLIQTLSCGLLMEW